jgi:serine/threonine protein kinase/WD40 repeat protein/Tfp pilus assembly protein PilF
MSDVPSEFDPVEELAESFLVRYRRGERPALSEYTQKHPELAEKIRDLFPALVMMEELGSVAKPANGREIDKPPASTPIPQQLGEYRILRQVGRGGMGVVYEAVQESLGRHVALKALPYHGLTNPQLLERFRREARAAARLHHTNIVPVFGVGEHEGIHFYAMQFIQGQSLDVVLKEIRRLRSGKASSSIPSPPPGEEIAEAWEELTVSLAHGLLTGDFQTREAPTIDSPLSKIEDGKSGTEKDESEQKSTEATESKNPCDSVYSVRSCSTSDLTTVSRGNYFRRVAMIGLQVADGLSYAHSQEVLHRDIKPSNLLLDTRGTVWITDFGLAKEEDSDELTRPGDIVGTMRYMAPERFEGRADARCDIYSLGMTLYELLTLHAAFEDSNRARLMKRIAQEVPARPRKFDPHTPRDLETIVLKAIAKEPADRYQTAAELAGDLQRFLADRPIRARRTPLRERAWRLCRRNPLVAALTLSVALLLVTIAGGSLRVAFLLHQEQEATQDQLDLTKKAEAKATLRLFHSLFNQARASRWSGRMGQRFQSLEALSQAAELLPTLHLEPKAKLELRNEAIACMVLPDLRTVKRWEGNPSSRGASFDGNLEHYARSDSRGNISVLRVDDDQEIMNLPGPGEPAWIVRFSPNGQYLAAKYHHANMNNANQFLVWDWKRQERVLQAPSPITGFDFSPDSRRLAIGFLDATLKVYDLISKTKEFIGLTQRPPVEWFAFHPDGQRLEVARNQRVEYWDLKTGKVGQTFTIPAGVHGRVWHPEGKLWATTSDKGYAIHVWNAFTGQLQAELKGHQAEVIDLGFNHAGDILVSNSWDGTIRLWDPWTGHQLLISSGGTQFSRDDRLMGGFAESRAALWEVALGRECRKLAAAQEVGKGPWSVDFSPDGRLLASGHEDGVRLWDVASSREAALLRLPPMPNSLTAIFDPDGGNLITTGTIGAYRWPIKWAVREGEAPAEPGPASSAGASSSRLAEIGPPQALGNTAGSDIWRASLSADGNIVALADHSHQQAIVLDIEGQPNKVLLHYSHFSIANIAISPDGQWVASAPWGDRSGTVRVFDIGNQKHVSDFPEPNTSNSIRFSPDSQWLFIGNQLWKTGSWKAGPVIEGMQTGELPLPLAFSPDGKILAIAVTGLSSQPVRLVDPLTRREFATLSVPYPEFVRWLCFSPDGSQLAACCSGHGIRVWDLRLIRQQLADMGLDWDLPPYPSVESAAPPKPLRVKVTGGDLARPQTAASPHDQLALYSLAIALAPLSVHPDPYHWRGHVYERLGKPQQAIDDFSAALRLLPPPANPKLQAHLHFVRARNYRQLKDYEQAIADLEKALEFAPQAADACNDLAWLYATGPENLRNPKKALSLAKSAVDLNPKRRELLNTLGVVYYRLGQYPEAIETLESSLRHNGGRSDAFDLFFLAMCYARLDKAAKATECYNRATKWVQEHQGQLSQEHAEELTNFRAEADAVLAKSGAGKEDK